MSINPHQLQTSTVRLLWSGILAVGILCLLATWNLGHKAGYVAGDNGRSSVAVSVDMPLQVTAEHSLALKRFFNRAKNQPSSNEPPAPDWALIVAELIAVQPLSVASLHHPVTQSSRIPQHQLQTLNVSRAPPLV